MCGTKPPSALDLLADIDVPQPFDLDELLERIGRHRGRPIHVMAEPALGAPEDGICGLWLELPTSDRLIIKAGLAPLHRETAVLHEVGHMLYDHGQTSSDDTWGAVLPTLTESGALHVHRVHARSRYEDAAEREAETFARTVLAHARAFAPGPVRTARPAAPDAARGVLDRLWRMFEATAPDESGDKDLGKDGGKKRGRTP